MLDKIERAVNGLTSLGALVGGIFTAVMTVIVTYAVVTRYLFNQPIGWSEEISIYLMIWAIFLGTAYTLKDDAHVGVDLLMNKLPPHIRPFFHGFHYLMGLCFLTLLFIKGIELVNLSIMLDNRSIALDIPLYIIQLSVPVGAGMLILQVLLKLLKLVCGWPSRQVQR